ncbi:hypothetical protein ABE437_04705, partial [Isoptericola cucumis]
GPLQVAVVGDGPAAADLLRAARRAPAAGAVVVPGAPDAAGVPLLAGRPLVDGRPAAYVCRGFVCDLPVTSTPALLGQLGTAAGQPNTGQPNTGRPNTGDAP